MAENATKRKNSISVVGYLKENGLRQITDKEGGKVICGNLIIATDDISSYKVQSFYVKELDSKGNINDLFITLQKFVNNEVVSIASFLKGNPGADFEQAKAAATQIWASGEYEEYAVKDGEEIVSTPTIRGRRVGFQADSMKEFIPHTKFAFTTYVESISEKDDKGNVIISGLVEGYDKNSRSSYAMNRVNLLCEADCNGVAVADYVSKNYKVGQTLELQGYISTVQTKTVTEAVTDGFGTANTPEQVITKITHDYCVNGGKVAPGTLAWTKEQAKAGLIVRDSKALDNADRKNNRKSYAAPVAEAPASAKVDVSAFGDDLDF